MGGKAPIMTNTDTSDGKYEQPLMNDNDEFGHNTRSSKVKDKPIKAGATDSNIDGEFARNPKAVTAPKNEGEHPGVEAARKTLAKVTSGKQDGEAF